MDKLEGLLAEVRRTLSSLGRGQSPFLPYAPGVGPTWRRFGLGLLAGAGVGAVALITYGLVLIVVLAIAWMTHLGLKGLSVPAIKELMKSGFEGERPLYLAEQIGILGTTALANSAFAACLVLVGSLVTRVHPRASLTAAPRWRWRHMAMGLILYGGFCLALFPLLDTSEDPPYQAIFRTLPTAITFSVFFVPAVMLAAAAEEVVFRGWLLRHAGVLVARIGLPILASSLIFGLIHWEDELDLNALLVRTAFGCGLCYMTLRLGGVEMATGAHAASNLVVFYLFQPLSLAPDTVEPFNPSYLLTAGLEIAGLVAVSEAVLRVPFLARRLGAG